MARGGCRTDDGARVKAREGVGSPFICDVATLGVRPGEPRARTGWQPAAAAAVRRVGRSARQAMARAPRCLGVGVVSGKGALGRRASALGRRARAREPRYGGTARARDARCRGAARRQRRPASTVLTDPVLNVQNSKKLNRSAPSDE
jgi:hypothetical protein